MSKFNLFYEKKKESKTKIRKVSYLFVLFLVILSFSIVSSEEFGYNYLKDGQNLKPSTTTSTTIIGGNLTKFLNLTDTPSSYSGEGSNCVRVNAGETALEFGSCATGSGDNSSWNQSLADTLYAPIKWDYNQSEATYNMWNDEWSSTYNSTYDSHVQDNESWNQSLADTLYAPISVTGDNKSWNESYARDIFVEGIESDLNVNSSDYWNNLNTINSTQMENSIGQLNIKESWLTTFINSFGFLIEMTNIFDQSLNTTDDVVFNSINSSNWKNVSITESQINDLSHTIDTDTHVKGDEIYLTNDSTTMYFNKTLLNQTIDARDNDTTYSHLSNFTDDLGDRGYSHLSNFTDDILWTTEFNSTGDSRWSGGGSGGLITSVNLTSGTYTGKITNGSYSGYKAGDEICNAEFSGSHFCTEFEVATWNGRSINNEDAWVIAGSPKYVPANIPVNDCNGWTHGTAGTYLGNYWHFNSTTGGDGRGLNCGSTFKLACCTY